MSIKSFTDKSDYPSKVGLDGLKKRRRKKEEMKKMENKMRRKSLAVLFGLLFLMLIGIVMSGCIEEPVPIEKEELEYDLNSSASEYLKTRFGPWFRNDTIRLGLLGPNFESEHTGYVHEGILLVTADGETVTKDVNFLVERDYLTYLNINVTCSTTEEMILYYEGKYRAWNNSVWLNGSCSMLLNERYMTKQGEPEIRYYSRTRLWPLTLGSDRRSRDIVLATATVEKE